MSGVGSGFAKTAKAPVQFVAREAARVSLNEQTKTAQFVQTVKEFKPTVFANDVKDFVAADVARFKAGQETHTKIAAKSIYTNTYNAVANATPRQMGEFLGGGLADTALFGGVTKGFTVVKSTVTSGARAAVNVAAKPIMSAGQKVLTSSSNFLGFNDAKAFKPAYNAATNPPVSASIKVEGLLFSGNSGVGKVTRKQLSFDDVSSRFRMTYLQKQSLVSGEQVVLENLELQSGDYTVFLFQKHGETLQVGVHTMFTSDKGGALFKFRNDAKSLARSLNCKELELFGADIINPKLQDILLKNGFRPGPDISFKINGGITTAPTLRKTLKLDELDVTLTSNKPKV